MAFFGNYIASIIAAERKAGKTTTAASMAARMGIRPSMMSRFINDPQAQGVNPKTLEKMCRGISDDPAVRAGLRIAYLRDQLGTGQDAYLVRIDLARDPRSREEEPFTFDYETLSKVAARSQLNERAIRAITKIIEASALSRRFRRCVYDLSEIAEHDIL